MDLLKNLKRIRIKRGFSRKELGKFLGVTECEVGRWERGERIPRLEILEKLARLLGYRYECKKVR